MNCVPLINPKPSFAERCKGCKLCLAKASFVETIVSPSQTFPSPINGKNKCDKGAKSPDAPTDPFSGTTGIISFSTINKIRSTTSKVTPEYPFDKACAFAINMVLEISFLIGFPTPTA